MLGRESRRPGCKQSNQEKSLGSCQALWGHTRGWLLKPINRVCYSRYERRIPAQEKPSETVEGRTGTRQVPGCILGACLLLSGLFSMKTTECGVIKQAGALCERRLRSQLLAEQNISTFKRVSCAGTCSKRWVVCAVGPCPLHSSTSQKPFRKMQPPQLE